MVQLSTPVIALHTAPLVVKTFFNHLGHKKKDRKKNGRQRAASEGKAGIAACSANPGVKSELEGLTETPEDEYESPESQLSYDEGLQIVKRFLQVAKDHTVEELQAFTAMHVPSPKWIHLTHVAIPESSIILSAEIITNHFKTFYGPNGLKEIGGGSWWQVRGRELEGEWIEMKKDYLKRTKRKVEEAKGVVWDDDPSEPGKADRVILYIHGGAYFFSSLDTHRYQIQRHARKLGGRAFAPSYRLAPQYPFPCGLHDALASYLFLLNPPEGSSQPAIPASILSGDSAGAGLVLSLLCIIRDSGGTVPMPAGASLISPWVDLTHSFKSIMGDDSGDYIPSEGFHYKPSFAWPPIRGNGITIEMKNEDGSFSSKTLDEQVQMYANNKLLSHPLVSPVNQGSLGGLCPLLILGGSSELLRDEMIYIAHKAAAPETYPPSSHVLERYPGQKEMVSHFPPTKVHLQMYDGCAHVTPTLSFTRPAKWMYRACANFNIWAITAAQLSEQRRLDHKLSHQYGHPYHNQQHQHQHQHQHYHSQPQQSFANDSSVDPSSVNSPSSGLSRSETLDASYAPSSNTSVESVMNADPSQPTIAKHITASVHELANEVDVVSDAGSECDSSDSEYCAANEKGLVEAGEVVIVSGREPLFVDSMVRERVSIRGRIRPFELVEKCDTFVNLDRDEVGKIHGDGPIAKWLQAREAHDKKFAKELAKYRTYKIQDRRAASQSGYITRDLPDTPPLSALAGWHDRETARKTAKSVDEVGRRGKSASGMLSVWMRASQKDEESRAHKDQVSSLEKELQELGVHGSEIDVLGDKKLKDVSRHLKKHAVIVVENPPRDESTFNPDKGRLVESKVEAKPAVKQVEAGSASGSPLSPNDRQKNKPSN